MSTKKIKWYEARDIANQIANRAFAHLTGSLETEIDTISKDVYTSFVAQFDVSLLLKSGIIGLNDSVSLKVSDGIGGDITVHYTVDELSPKVINVVGYGVMEYENAALYERLSVVSEALAPYKTKRNQLANELQTQLEGKTASQAMKNWPEVTDIISKVLNFGVPAMTVPLEQLLGRFLLALPAPKEE